MPVSTSSEGVKKPALKGSPPGDVTQLSNKLSLTHLQDDSGNDLDLDPHGLESGESGDKDSSLSSEGGPEYSLCDLIDRLAIVSNRDQDPTLLEEFGGTKRPKNQSREGEEVPAKRLSQQLPPQIRPPPDNVFFTLRANGSSGDTSVSMSRPGTDLQTLVSNPQENFHGLNQRNITLNHGNIGLIQGNTTLYQGNVSLNQEVTILNKRNFAQNQGNVGLNQRNTELYRGDTTGFFSQGNAADMTDQQTVLTPEQFVSRRSSGHERSPAASVQLPTDVGTDGADITLEKKNWKIQEIMKDLMSPPYESESEVNILHPPRTLTLTGPPGLSGPPLSSPNSAGLTGPPLSSPGSAGFRGPPLSSPRSAGLTGPPLSSPNSERLTGPPVSLPSPAGLTEPAVSLPSPPGLKGPPVSLPGPAGLRGPPASLPSPAGLRGPPVGVHSDTGLISLSATGLGVGVGRLNTQHGPAFAFSPQQGHPFLHASQSPTARQPSGTPANIQPAGTSAVGEYAGTPSRLQPAGTPVPGQNTGTPSDIQSTGTPTTLQPKSSVSGIIPPEMGENGPACFQTIGPPRLDHCMGASSSSLVTSSSSLTSRIEGHNQRKGSSNSCSGGVGVKSPRGQPPSTVVSVTTCLLTSNTGGGVVTWKQHTLPPSPLSPSSSRDTMFTNSPQSSASAGRLGSPPCGMYYPSPAAYSLPPTPDSDCASSKGSDQSPRTNRALDRSQSITMKPTSPPDPASPSETFHISQYSPHTVFKSISPSETSHNSPVCLSSSQSPPHNFLHCRDAGAPCHLLPEGVGVVERGEGEEEVFAVEDVVDAVCNSQGVWLVDEEGDTFLHSLSGLEDEREAVDYLCRVQHNPGFLSALNARNNSFETPVYCAVCLGRVILAAHMIRLGANVNIQCRFGTQMQSALHKAVDSGNLAMVDVLMRSDNINLNAQRGSDQCTPLMVALMKHVPDNSRCDRLDIITSLLEDSDGLNLNATEPRSGKTALMMGVETKDVRVVDALLCDLDPDTARYLINMQNRAGNSAVHLAAGLRDVSPQVKEQILWKLIQLGGDTTKKNNEGDTPKDWARNMIDRVARLR